jgi:cathepsin B
MKIVCLLIVGAAGKSFEQIAEAVNSGNHGWTAQAPSKFATLDDVRPFLGAFRPGDERYEEPEVEELPGIEEMNDKLPNEFDSATKWPKCTVIGHVRDQSACGSCWAFGSVQSFESRRCIATGKNRKFSPEDTAFCSDAGDGCNGGNSAWSWYKSHGVVTGGDYTDIGSGDTCLPYSLKPCAHHVAATAEYPDCPADDYENPTCTEKCSEDGYTQHTNYKHDKKKASHAYSRRCMSGDKQCTEKQIKHDLVKNGPMYASFDVYSDFPTYSGGVYKHTTDEVLGGHAVTLVGYGTDEHGTPYWKVKNNWNEGWGLGGHFLIKRGSDECGIESGVIAGNFSSSEVVV